MGDTLKQCTDDEWLALYLAEEGESTLTNVIRRLVAERDQLRRQAAAGYKVPGPYDIAMAFGPALLASGRFDNAEGAMAAAWFAVPAFYAGRDAYLAEMVPALYGRSALDPPADSGIDAAGYERSPA